MSLEEKQGRTAQNLEENLKKAVTEMLILALLRKREYYIGELTSYMERLSRGALSIAFPYAVIYRMTKAEYIVESQKRTAPDGRLRQYYRLTAAGAEYLSQLLVVYRRFTAGISDILTEVDSNECR